MGGRWGGGGHRFASEIERMRGSGEMEGATLRYCQFSLIIISNKRQAIHWFPIVITRALRLR